MAVSELQRREIDRVLDEMFAQNAEPPELDQRAYLLGVLDMTMFFGEDPIARYIAARVGNMLDLPIEEIGQTMKAAMMMMAAIRLAPDLEKP